MPTLIYCPQCDKPLRVPDHGLGKKVRCPSCTTVLVALPPAEVIPTPAAPPPLPTAHPQGITVAPDAPMQVVPILGGRGPRPPRRPPAKRSRWPLVAAGVGLTLLVVGGVVTFLLLRGDGERAAVIADHEWQPFAHAEGRFEVLLPGRPVEQVVPVQIPGGVLNVKVFQVELHDRNVSFALNYQDVPGHVANALPNEQHFQNGLSGALNSVRGRLRKETPVQLGSHPGREWVIEAPAQDMVIVQRTYLVRVRGNLRAYSINIGARGEPAPADAKKFFDSFRLVGLPERTLTLPGGDRIAAIALAAGDRELFTLDEGGTVKRHSAVDGAVLTSVIPAPDGGCRQMAVSADGKRLVLLGHSGLVRLAGPAPGEVGATLEPRMKGGRRRIQCAAISADGKLVAAGDNEGEIKIWDADGLKLRHALQSEEGGILAAAFSPDGKTLATAGWRLRQLWDTATGQELAVLEVRQQHPDPETELTFSPDGRLLAVTEMNRVRLWDVASREEKLRHEAPGRARLAKFTADGKAVAAVLDPNGAFNIWDAAGQHRLAFRPEASDGLPHAPRGLAFTADGKQMVVAINKEVQWWELGRLAAAPPPLPQPLTPVKAEPVARDRLVLQAHEREVLALRFSDDGKELLSGGCDRAVRRWDLASGRLVGSAPPLPHRPLPFGGAAFAPGGDALALVKHGHVRTLAWPSRKETVFAEGGAQQLPAQAAAYSPDGKTLVTAHGRGEIQVWDVAGGKLRATLTGHTATGHTAAVGAAAVSPDGKTLASGGNDSTVRLWDLNKGAELASLELPERAWVHALAFSHDGKTLASADGKWVRLWDVAGPRGDAAGAEPRGLLTERASFASLAAFWSVAFSPKGDLVAAGSQDSQVRLWDPATGAARGRAPAHAAGMVKALAFSKDGTRLAAGVGRDVLVVETAALAKPGPADDMKRASKEPAKPDAQGRVTLKGHARDVIAVAFAPGGKALLSASQDGTVKVWDAEKGRQRDNIGGDSRRHYELAAVTGDAVVLAALTGNPMRIDLKSRIGREFPAAVKFTPKDAMRSVAVSPDGRLLVTGHMLSEARVWDVAGEKLLHTLSGHKGAVSAAAVSPGGKVVATGGFDGTVRLWDPATGKELPALPQRGIKEKPARVVKGVAFSDDGATLAACWLDGAVRLYRVEKGELVHEWKAAGEARTVALAPGGKRVAVGRADGRVEVWDAATGQLSASLAAAAPLGVRSLAFSPDGGRLAVSASTAVELWDLSVALKGGKP